MLTAENTFDNMEVKEKLSLFVTFCTLIYSLKLNPYKPMDYWPFYVVVSSAKKSTV